MLAIVKEIADTASNPINDFCSTIAKSIEKIIEDKAATKVMIPTKKRIRFMMFIFLLIYYYDTNVKLSLFKNKQNEYFLLYINIIYDNL